VEEARVSEVTASCGQVTIVTNWPDSMRIFTRQRRPHPGTQLSLCEAEDGYAYVPRVANLPATTKGGRANLAYINVGHQVQISFREIINPQVTAPRLPRNRNLDKRACARNLRFCDRQNVAYAAPGCASMPTCRNRVCIPMRRAS
jgi:hypothetical protein